MGGKQNSDTYEKGGADIVSLDPMVNKK